MSYVINQGVMKGSWLHEGRKLLGQQNLSKTRIISLKLRNKLNYAWAKVLMKGINVAYPTKKFNFCV